MFAARALQKKKTDRIFYTSITATLRLLIKLQSMGWMMPTILPNLIFLIMTKTADLYLVNHPGSFANAMRLQGKIVNGKQVLIEDTTSQLVSDRLYENRGNKFVDVTKKPASQIRHLA